MRLSSPSPPTGNYVKKTEEQTNTITQANTLTPAVSGHSCAGRGQSQKASSPKGPNGPPDFLIIY